MIDAMFLKDGWAHVEYPRFQNFKLKSFLLLTRLRYESRALTSSNRYMHARTVYMPSTIYVYVLSRLSLAYYAMQTLNLAMHVNQINKRNPHANSAIKPKSPPTAMLKSLSAFLTAAPVKVAILALAVCGCTPDGKVPVADTVTE
jgi:hypothetical protein